MDYKKNLKAFMMNSPKSVVGFFETASDVLKDMSVEWENNFNTHKEKVYLEWSKVFAQTSESIKNVAVVLTKVSNEFNKEKAAEEDKDPSTVIDKFKTKIKTFLPKS